MSGQPQQKKRKRSGCSGFQASLLFDHLCNFRNVLDESHQDSVEVDVADDSQLRKLLDSLIAEMKPLVNGTEKSITFSSATELTLEDLNITQTYSDALVLGHDVEERARASALLGKDQFMSSATMYKQLDMLANLLSMTSEASARAWVDVFIYRASAMLTPPNRMILYTQHSVPSTKVSSFFYPSTAVSGYLEYTVAITKGPVQPGYFWQSLTMHQLRKFDSLMGFFVVEAEPKKGLLGVHLPQVVAELSAAAKTLGKDQLRGVLTNGFQWIFFIVYINKDGKGGTFKKSVPIMFAPQAQYFTGEMKMAIPQHIPDMICGILTYWLEHSYEDLRDDDWLKLPIVS